MILRRQPDFKSRNDSIIDSSQEAAENGRARMHPAQPNRRGWDRTAHRAHDTPVAATAGLRTRSGI